ncbi:DUF1850 domain-containing protein [Azospirillum halopraeferens]|uniref:DUF1850 domain-containing protein n=1 Tax=Azospirillum halopraeferens TaxID=34010 RepID=UPI00048F65A4|nr:DUF1850 domain-containing protein [Azospirillum halopraeferens]
MSGGLCIALLGGMVLAAVPGERFTLAWTHSIERTEWREVWRIVDGRLVIESARVKGTGAGMEPGEGARLVDGWWEWTPALPPLERIVLAASEHTADHRLCADGDCRPLRGRTGPGHGDDPLVLEPCP